MGNKPNLHYSDYLGLPALLDLQRPESARQGKPVHDEHLFIIVHQVYELWFKQIIWELNSLRDIFAGEVVQEKALSVIVQRIQRVGKIQTVLNGQLAILETMTPMDFLEFRDILMPASGLQSTQFRAIETILGTPLNSQGRSYLMGQLPPQDRQYLANLAQKPSLLQGVESWLERIPFLEQADFHFWRSYRQVVRDLLECDRRSLAQNPHLGESELATEQANLEATARTFESLFDPKAWQEQVAAGRHRLSQRAMQAALFISLYREQSLLSMPYQMLSGLMDFDQALTTWRHQHALMAHRMLGKKIGTGGTSGHHYLKMAADQNRVFTDLFDLSSFFIPKSQLPPLPPSLEQLLNFDKTQ